MSQNLGLVRSIYAAWGRAARRDGLIVSLKAYARREDALGDLGVSEHELERLHP